MALTQIIPVLPYLWAKKEAVGNMIKADKALEKAVNFIFPVALKKVRKSP